MSDRGTPVTHVSSGGRSLDRESITVLNTIEPVRFYRTSDPPLFAGFQIGWIDGEDEETGVKFNLSAGPGVGSKYMTLKVDIPGRPTVYEYVDMYEVLTARVTNIIEKG